MLQGMAGSAMSLFNKRLGTGIEEPAPRKGNFMGVVANKLTGPAGEKRRVRQRPLSPDQLERLAEADPVISAIRRARKDQVKQCRWDIVPDIDDDISLVQKWFRKTKENMNPWGLTVDLELKDLRKDVFQKFGGELQRIVDSNADIADMRAMMRWLLNQALRYMEEEAEKHCKEVKKLFECPNREYSTFGDKLERDIDDLMIWDASATIKNPSRTNPKILAEIYNIPGAECFKYINDDESIPEPPENAFVWIKQGQMIAEWTDEELMYICENLKYDHYGMSPTETVAYLTAATIKADTVNRQTVYRDWIPPVLFNLGKRVSDEDRQRFTVELDSRLQQDKPYMAVSKLGEDFSIERLGMTPKEMQLYEYLKWSVSIKAAVFQISPQDIGFTMDLHRTTSEVQYRITKDRGLRSMLMTLEDAYNREIVKQSYPFEDTKLKFLDIDKMDAVQQSQLDHNDMERSVISLNDRRANIGKKPKEGGDHIWVEDPRNPQSRIPIEMLDDIADDMLENKEATQEAPSDDGGAQADPNATTTEEMPQDSQQPQEMPASKPPAKGGGKESKEVEVKGTPDDLKSKAKKMKDKGVKKLIKYDLDFPHLEPRRDIIRTPKDEAIAIAEATNTPVGKSHSEIAETVVAIAQLTAFTAGSLAAAHLISKIGGSLASVGTRTANRVWSTIKRLWKARRKTIKARGIARRVKRAIVRGTKRAGSVKRTEGPLWWQSASKKVKTRTGGIYPPKKI